MPSLLLLKFNVDSIVPGSKFKVLFLFFVEIHILIPGCTHFFLAYVMSQAGDVSLNVVC